MVIETPFAISMGSPGRSEQEPEVDRRDALVGPVDAEDLVDHAELEERRAAAGTTTATLESAMAASMAENVRG